MTLPEVCYQSLTPLSFLERSIAVYPEREAIVYRQKSWNYAEFGEIVRQLATALQYWGINPGDRVAFLCPNIPPLLAAHFAIPLAGGVLVAINTRLELANIGHILNNCGARLLFVDSEWASAIASIRPELKTIATIITIIDEQADTPRNHPFESDYNCFLKQGGDRPLTNRIIDENNTISLNYTSGTSGQAKGVMYSHRGTYLNALGEVLELGLNQQTRYLWTLPLFHCNGWCFPWAIVAVGGVQVCLRRFFPKTVIQLLEEEAITHFCASPTLLIVLANDPHLQTLRLKHSVRVATAGAPPSPTLLQAMETLGIEITHVYGLTETYGPHSICEWQSSWNDLPAGDRARLKARQGVPYLHALEMRVVDVNLNDVPADGKTMGEVVMRGNNVMKGYFNDPEATARAFAGGWFHSGDLGVRHPDGYIELRDRAKDIVISSGVNISTIEIEQVIYRHRSVFEVAVIAIPDDLRGEVPKAFVTLKEGSEATSQEIIEFCHQQLASYKCPKAVEFREELPKTATGKFQKYLLREPEWEGYDKRIH